MSEVPEWKRDVGLMHDIIVRQQLGPYDQTPRRRLQIDLSAPLVAAAYEEVLEFAVKPRQRAADGRQVEGQSVATRVAQRIGTSAASQILPLVQTDAAELSNPGRWVGDVPQK